MNKRIKYKDFECSEFAYYSLVDALNQLKSYKDYAPDLDVRDRFHTRACLLCTAVKHCESCPVLHCTNYTCNYDYLDSNGVTHPRLPIDYTNLHHLPRMIQIGEAILRHAVIIPLPYE